MNPGMYLATIRRFTSSALVAVCLHAAPATAESPGPQLLVLEKEDRMLAIADTDRLEILGRVDAGEDPHEVVASADGRRAYISNYGAFATPLHRLSVVDLVARKPLPAVELGALRAPHGLDLANGMVYFTAEGSKAVGRYNPGTASIDWVLGVGQDRTHMLVVTSGGNRIFTTNVNSDTVSILAPGTDGDVSGWTASTIRVGKGPEGFDVAPDRKELWVANSHDGTVSIVALHSLQVTQTLDLHMKFANRLKFTPDGRRVLVSDLGTGELVVIDVATRAEAKRLSLGHGAAGILLARDGRHAFVAVSRDNYIADVDLQSLSVVGHIATGKGPDGMAWAVAH